MAKRKATPAPKAVEEVKEEAVENGSDVEMKDEAENGDDKADKIPLFIPSINEFRKDLGYNYDSRTLMVGPVKFNELNRGKLSIVTQKAEYVQVKLAKQGNNDLQGYLELMFPTEAHAVACMGELDAYKNNGVVVKHMKHVDNKPVDVDDVRAALGGRGKIDNSDAAAEKVVVVSQLPPEVTAEEIKEQIKEATTVVFPNSHVTNERKSYAYVEVPLYKNVRYHDGWNLKFGENKCKCKKLERIPKVTEVLRDLRKYKQRLVKKEQLDALAKEELNTLHKYGTHYERSEWVDDEKKESLKELLETYRTAKQSQGNNKGGFKRNRGNNSSGMSASQLTASLTLLSALSGGSLGFNKKQKFGKNQRW